MATKAPGGLNVGGGLVLPLDAITQSIALLAVRRAGKSNAAAVIAEEMYHASLPWVAVDPKGDWWGLRSSGDGTGPGLPIPIFGGLHGDMPLAPEAGKLIAELIVDENLTCVLDVSEFASKAAQMRFLTDLAEHMFKLHGRTPQPRHIFLEEADDVVPQRVMREMARCVGAWSKLVKQGGSRGIGISLISQRSAVINKDCLTQTETMIALRTTSPQDRKAISEWVSYHDVARELVDSLPGLDDGEAWVCSPHWLGRHGQDPIQRVQFRQRATFDSGSTPTMAARRRPATLADIDLGALAGRMAAVTEKAAADDPKALRAQIASLEKRLRAAAPTADEDRLAGENERLRAELAQSLIDLQQARAAAQVEVPVLQPGDIAATEQAITALRDVTGSLEIALSRATRTTAAPAPPARPVAPAVARPAPAPRPVTARPPSDEPGAPLTKPQRAILTVLAQYPDGRSRLQVALLSGYSAKSSSFSNALGALRTAGMVNRDDPIRALDAGVAALGSDWEPLPAGADLVDYWMGRLSKPERAILQALIASWPEPLTKEDVSAASGYSLTSSSLSNALGRLRSLEMAVGYGDIVADETLAQAAREARGSTQ